MARLILERLDAWYGRTHAVDHIDLVVEDGELCVLLGPSGSGKTTTLRMIAGFVRPSEGEIYLDNQRITYLYPGQRNIGMVFQSYALYPHMTVREQLIFPLKKLRLNRDDINKMVNEIADLLHIRDLLELYPQQLSSGQRQRVALGRALIRRPALLLLDEPLNNVDPMLREEVRIGLRRLQQDLRITTVYVTHDQMEAQALADKIAVMYEGRIQQVGTPQEIYHHPANIFVAGFIGTPPINFIKGEIVVEEDTVFVRSELFRIPVPREKGCALVNRADGSQEIILGIRPEHLQIRPPNEGLFDAEVTLVEPQGHEMIILLSLQRQELRCRIDRHNLGLDLIPGDRVGIFIDPHKLYVFDKITEKRIL